MEPAKALPVSSADASAARGELSIGTILIHAGRLTLENAERILVLQRERGLRFGDAAVELGLLTQDDIEFALARQFDYPYLKPGTSKVSEEVVAAYAPFSTQVRSLAALRGQLMLRWFDESEDRRTLAVISAEQKEGRSFVAANLAVSFAQLGQKTLLIDADLRKPKQHILFGTESRSGLSTMLSGRGRLDMVIQRIPGLLGLSVLPAGPLPPNPVELLARRPFPELLAQLAKEFQVILLDSPPAAECPEAQTVALRAGAAIIVARKNITRMWRVRGVSDKMTHASTVIVGSVLNQF